MMEQRDNNIFLEGLKELGITLTPDQLLMFEQYYDMLVEKNKVMNLTAITEYNEVITKHFLDSLSLIKLMDLTDKKLRILDMGTGAGFPGIPLKIAFPKLQITLMDSLNKRILFLQDVIKELNLKDITAIHGRAEEAAGKAEYREKFDLCVSRAVAKLNSLCEFCIPFVKQTGYFIPYKSGNVEEELKDAKFAIHELGGTFVRKEQFCLPNSDMERTLLLIKKVEQTKKKYPRAGGKPLSQPLTK